tara:strand:- start:1071 stop:1262 length:192 start_codon:yes stop_codon:yes gene_type:complete
MRTIVEENKSTSITTDNVRVRIEEDEDRVYITVFEKTKEIYEPEITNNLTITKARELGLDILD